jgi:hypothetical protein
MALFLSSGMAIIQYERPAISHLERQQSLELMLFA